ncbi:MAG TPA: TetR/AcrR family transcriptional regulator [Gaiellaceae bacterium]|jgi:AcrR family transcriptional regulator|nr:TetR/AcrR family transcriptional regulator [Gaiellaceae bacterium]
MSTTKGRLSAQERRADVLETACQIFSKAGYQGATTAEIARGSGVSEPILYRHFASKRELYLACLSEAWVECRAMWEAAIADEPDPGLWIGTMGRSYLAAKDKRGYIAGLWVQALTEASEDPEIRRFIRRHMREVHQFVADVIRRAQKAGGIVPERDPDAEAWIFIAIGLLGTVSKRLGGLVDEDFPKIFTSRLLWMTGSTE